MAARARRKEKKKGGGHNAASAVEAHARIISPGLMFLQFSASQTGVCALMKCFTGFGGDFRGETPSSGDEGVNVVQEMKWHLFDGEVPVKYDSIRRRQRSTCMLIRLPALIPSTSSQSGHVLHSWTRALENRH